MDHIIDLTSTSESKCSSKKRKRTKADDSTAQSNKNVYFFDNTPSLVSHKPTNQTTQPQPENPSQALILPSHVSVIGDHCIIQVPAAPTPDPSQEQYIEYLEYDTKDMPPVRYFDDPSVSNNQPIHTKRVCKNCGAEDSHKSNQCPVIICYTCGARDEHPPRSCPISKTCYNCGMRGHISSKCPNRYSLDPSKQRHACDNCGSGLHQASECPALWRIYAYQDSDERDTVVATRTALKNRRLGDGGEGYIPDDQWCYNCGEAGHWGDDCDESFRPGHPKEPSSFSLHNLRSGPFYDPGAESAILERPRNTRPSSPSDSPDHLFAGMPDRVGSRGKMNDRKKLERRERDYEEKEDDWFDTGVRRNPRPQPAQPPRSAPKVSFSIKGAALASKNGSHPDLPESTVPSLQSRLENRSTRRSHHDRDESSRYSQPSQRNDRGYDRPPRNGRKGDSHYSPQYMGGYRR